MVKVPINLIGNKTVNKARTTALLGLGLGLAIQSASATAWTQWYSQGMPYAPAPNIWFYQYIPTAPAFGPAQPWRWLYQTPTADPGGLQFWQFQSTPYQPTTIWSSTMSASGLYLEQNETPVGYMIRVRTGQNPAPAVDISVQDGFLMIRNRSVTGPGGGIPLQMRQTSWTTQWISLPEDANVAAMKIKPGAGVVDIFIPRFR